MSGSDAHRPEAADGAASSALAAWGPGGRDLRLFLISVLGLYLELLLIRWVTTEVRIFAYLQNTVLVVCFLGLGMGCFTCRRPIALRPALIRLVGLTALFAIPFTRRLLGYISVMLSVLEDFEIWSRSSSTSPVATLLLMTAGLGLTFLLMALIWDIFVPIGRLLGRLLNDHPRTIWAYSINVAGSLVGTWLFVGLSVLHQPPVVWLIVLAALLVWFLDPKPHARLIDGGLLAALVVLGFFAGLEPQALEVTWSPYQKLVLRESRVSPGLIGTYNIEVNNANYQDMIDLAPPRVAADPATYPPDLRGLSQYDLPGRLHPNPQRVLIVGAGSGNDAAGALRQGAAAVTAVEIDPVIISMGERFHPEAPYASPKVRVINDDARAYFAGSNETFDLICFGLLDSHTTGVLTNTRLDHYVYTRESLQQAKRLLAKGGVMVLSFWSTRPYISDRMAGVLREVFGQEPLSYHIPFSPYGRGGVMFVAGDLAAVRRQIAAQPALAEHLERWRIDPPAPLGYQTALTTDDWPYVYLQKARIPTLYWLLAVLIAALYARGQVALKQPLWIAGWSRTHWHFFFLGAAFLLLEVQNVSKAAVALGSTWWVNAVIISGVLAMVLLANAVAAVWPSLPLNAVYAGLIASCLGLSAIDIAQFSAWPFAGKALIVGGLTTAPMLFSGIVFIRSFTAVADKDRALGANLLGALCGGLLQSLTFVTGIRALLYVVAALYLVALATRPSRTAVAVTETARQPAAGVAS